jgi:hypothetical protein
MPTLNRSQVEMYARSAGLPVPLFVDIAMAESSGRTDVVNGIGCVGLWQINQREHVKDHPSWSVGWLKDPMNNARAAATLYRQFGTRPWVSSQAKWGESAADRVKDVVRAPLDVVTAPVDAALETARGIARVADAVERAGAWISTPANMVRVAYVAVGGVMVIVAVGQITEPLWRPAADAVTSAVGTVAGVAGPGKVARVAGAAASAAA